MRLSKLAAAGVLALGFIIPFGSGVASAQTDDCKRDDYCGPDTPDVGDSDDECIPDADAVDSDGPGGTDDEENCDSGEVMPDDDEQCVYDDDTVDSDGAGGVDDEVACGSTSGGPGGVEVPTGGPAQVEVPEGGPLAQQAPTGTLPFTGGDVVGMTIVALVAIGIGVALVRTTRKPGVY